MVDDVHYDIIRYYGDVHEAFHNFLTRNKFFDMSSILVMRLDLYMILNPFMERYIEMHIKNKTNNELIMMLYKEMNYRCSRDRDNLIRGISFYKKSRLMQWYDKNKELFLLRRKDIDDDEIDRIISRALMCELYY